MIRWLPILLSIVGLYAVSAGVAEDGSTASNDAASKFERLVLVPD